jgi:hypothetical protein
VPTKGLGNFGTIIQGIEVISLGIFGLLSTQIFLKFSKKGDLYNICTNSLQFAQ